MPGITIADQIQAEGVTIPIDGPPVAPPAATEAPAPNPWADIKAFVFKRSPKVPIADYHDHAFNWRRDPDGRDGLAQIIRGLSGWLGDLNFCLADVILGYLKLTTASKGTS